jgi:tRNA(Ile)-lysidine synthetase-like protein
MSAPAAELDRDSSRRTAEGLVRAAQAFFAQHPALAGRQVILAVSGGVDSVVLAHLAARDEVWPGARPGLILAHLHHGLRGEAADADQRFCRNLAVSLGMEFATGNADVKADAARGGVSPEAAARRARYGFLARVATEHGAGAVFLAHHADDQVETVLLNASRGAGVTGWAGMPPVRGLDPVWARPFLSQRRETIETYARAHRLRWREDASNADLVHRRNRIRRQVVPALDADGDADWPSRALRLAAVAQRLRAWLRPRVEALLAESAGSIAAGQGIAICRRRLTDAPAPLREEALREAFRRGAAAAGRRRPPALCRSHTAALARLLLGKKTGARIDLPLKMQARLTRTHLVCAASEAVVSA